jgi:hypothetical protein
MTQTAVEWLENKLDIILPLEFEWDKLNNIFKQAKEMEKSIAEEYAEFCIRCDRAGLPIVKFNDWRKELTFKSE